MSTTNPTNQTTEWDDLQRKFGNLPPLEKEVKEEELYLKAVDKIENANILENKNLNELNRLEENCVDDEYLKIIQKYKNDRLNEIKKNKALEIFGDVYEITKENFVTEINDASAFSPLNKINDQEKENDAREMDGQEEMDEQEMKKKEEHKMAMEKKGKHNKHGTYVILHLYSENVMACKILNNIMKEAARKYKYVKFTKGVHNKIIENYPESKTPTILIYYNGICIQQICNLLLYIGGGLSNLNLKSFEKLLKKYDVIKIKKQKKGNDALSDDSDEEDGESTKNRKTQKQYTAFNMFNKTYEKEKDEDDDDDDEDDSSDKTEDQHTSASKGYASSFLDNQMRRYRF